MKVKLRVAIVYEFEIEPKITDLGEIEDYWCEEAGNDLDSIRVLAPSPDITVTAEEVK